MALDEAVLDSGWAGLSLRVYRWPPAPERGATFGYGQPFEGVASAAAARWGDLGPALVRRATGGGLVFHDGDLTFSLVFPWPELSVPTLVYKDVHVGVHLGLKALGIPTRLWSPPAARPAGVALRCFPEPEPVDLVDEWGRKLLGGALRRRRGVGLYQGSLRPEGLPADPGRVAAAVVEGLSLKWRALFSPAAAESEELEAARALEAKYLSERWNRRR